MLVVHKFSVVVHKFLEILQFRVSQRFPNFFLQDFLGKSDPFLEIWLQNSDGTWTISHRLVTRIKLTNLTYNVSTVFYTTYYQCSCCINRCG